jgi:hypothetical protein
MPRVGSVARVVVLLASTLDPSCAPRSSRLCLQKGAYLAMFQLLSYATVLFELYCCRSLGRRQRGGSLSSAQSSGLSLLRLQCTVLYHLLRDLENVRREEVVHLDFSHRTTPLFRSFRGTSHATPCLGSHSLHSTTGFVLSQRMLMVGHKKTRPCPSNLQSLSVEHRALREHEGKRGCLE